MTFTTQSFFQSVFQSSGSAGNSKSVTAKVSGNNWAGKFICSLVLLLAMCGNAWAEKINLNTADAEALQYIPGIGPSKSIDIIELRQASDGFRAFDELLDVRGIGEKTLTVIRQYGSLDSGVATLTEEMRANPPKRPARATAKSADGGEDSANAS